MDDLTPDPIIEILLARQEDGAETVGVTDDGRVCYAYFYRGRSLTGHVWLYNRVESVEEMWMGTGRGQPPINPKAYVSDEPFAIPSNEGQFDFHWRHREGVWEVGVYIDGILHAVVGDGDLPGWCRLAKQDNPLAQTLR